MAATFKNPRTGQVATLNGAVVSLTGNLNNLQVALPFDGKFPWAYDFNISGDSEKFLLVYSGEFLLRQGRLFSASMSKAYGDVDLGGVNVGQFYKWDGTPIGNPIWISSETNQGHRPGVSALKGGGYIIVWQTNNPIGLPSSSNFGYIVGRFLSADGNDLGKTFVIDSSSVLLKEKEAPTDYSQDGSQ